MAVVIPVVIHFIGKRGEAVMSEEQFAPARIFVSVEETVPSFRPDGYNYLEFSGGSGAELHFAFGLMVCREAVRRIYFSRRSTIGSTGMNSVENDGGSNRVSPKSDGVFSRPPRRMVCC